MDFLEKLPSISDVLPDRTKLPGGQRFLMYLNCDTREEAEKVREAADGKVSKKIGHKATDGRVRAVLKCDLTNFRASQVTDVKVNATVPPIILFLSYCYASLQECRMPFVAQSAL